MTDLETRPSLPVAATPCGGHATVIVIDYGAQYAQLIARRVREAKVYSEIVPSSTPSEQIIASHPAAIILSGGPSSVYADDAPQVDRSLLEAGIPVLGICYGFQAMADALGGVVKRTRGAEFGRTAATPLGLSVLLGDRPGQTSVWMSHRDAVVTPPPGFRITASTQNSDVAAFEDANRRLFGVQWHPEVGHTVNGQDLIERFLYDGALIEPTWVPENIITESINSIRSEVGTRHVICGLSGGVDSAVAAALVHEAVGDQLTCVFVDHGMLREGERKQVEEAYVDATGVSLRTIDASEKFLNALDGITDPEEKRKVIGRLFIRVFEEAANDIALEHFSYGESVEFLVQGTLYPDIVESGGGSGADVIKSHHNVGGLPDDITFKLIEPLRTLFKDEVRRLGLALGLPEEMVWRHPFPGPGLAIRIVGAVSAERLAIVRKADAIAQEETRKAHLDRDAIWQFPVVLLADVRSVGVQGDERTYGHPIVLRPVKSEDAMTADWARLPEDLIEAISTRITNEVEEVNRVLVDVTSKPPGSIEWE